MVSTRSGMPLPPVGELLESAEVVSLPMRTRFRGLDVREVMIFTGPAGWGEFGAFVEYDDVEASAWLAAGIESAWLGPPAPRRRDVPVNATVPAVPADEVAAILARNPGARTAKVKVAEPGGALAEDVERVAAAREIVPRVRIDANGGWTVDEAVEAISAIGEVEYAEQPCASIAELAEVRRRVSVPVAADESIRKSDDPLRIVAADAADVAILKVAPLGGMRRVLELAEQIAMPVVISSALDSAVGISAGVATAAALPELDLDCGLGTGTLLVEDVASPFLPIGGAVSVRRPDVDRDRIPALRAPEVRRRWWHERLVRCHRLLASGTVA